MKTIRHYVENFMNNEFGYTEEKLQDELAYPSGPVGEILRPVAGAIIEPIVEVIYRASQYVKSFSKKV